MKILVRRLVSLCLLLFLAFTAVAPDVFARPIVPKSLDALPGKGPTQEAKWFEGTWKTRRTKWTEERTKDEGAVVFLGDSITHGWNSLAQDFPNLKVANRGIGGDTTRGLLYRVQEDVLDLHPKAVVVLIGTNDLGLGADPEDVADNIKALLIAMKKADPKLPVIVCNVMPSDPSRKRTAPRIKKLNAAVDDAIKGEPNWIRCDTWSIFANEDGNAKKEEFPDLLHPNAAGYAKWKAALEPIFARLNLTAAQNK